MLDSESVLSTPGYRAQQARRGLGSKLTNHGIHGIHEGLGGVVYLALETHLLHSPNSPVRLLLLPPETALAVAAHDQAPHDSFHLNHQHLGEKARQSDLCCSLLKFGNVSSFTK